MRRGAARRDRPVVRENVWRHFQGGFSPLDDRALNGPKGTLTSWCSRAMRAVPITSWAKAARNAPVGLCGRRWKKNNPDSGAAYRDGPNRPFFFEANNAFSAYGSPYRKFPRVLPRKVPPGSIERQRGFQVAFG